MFITLSFVVCGFYAFLVLRALKGWRLIDTSLSDKHETSIGFSVIVPYRNEGANLPFLLADLDRTSTIPDEMEILFVNDSSEDSGSQVISEWSTSIPHKDVLATGHGKKAAIHQGAEAADYDRIVTIDADVRLPENWIASIARLISAHDHLLMILPVIPSRGRTAVGRFATMEYLALLGATFSSAALGSPIMASGAALVFDRTLLSTEDHSIASGDDMFILHRAKQRSMNVGHCLNMAVAAHVAMPETLSAVWTQRLRWTAKSSEYRDTDTLWVAWIVLALNTLLAALLIFSIIDHALGYTAICVFVLKSVLDLAFLWKIHSFLGRRHELWSYPFFALAYPFYVPLVAVASRFTSFEWKGRSHSR